MEDADFLVIGAGPGGCAAAFRAADLGRLVTIIDPRPVLGGVCLNEGCIPSKMLLHAAGVIRGAAGLADWGVEFGKPKIRLQTLRDKRDSIVLTLNQGLTALAARRKVSVVQGAAAFSGENTVEVRGGGGVKRAFRFKDAVIAAGSNPVFLPDWPSSPRILDSAGALALASVPDELVVVGGGVIGLEMATVYSALGSQVTIVEAAGQVIPGADPDAVRVVRNSLEAEGCVIHCATQVKRIEAGKSGVKLTCSGAFEGVLAADIVIQAVGRKADVAQLKPESAGLTAQPDGTLSVDETCRTRNPHIYAAGDVTGNPMLAHRAAHQGKVAAEAASGLPAAMDTQLIPSVAYTSPELAWVGHSESSAQAAGLPFKVSKFPWSASGRNLASGGAAGLTKILWRPDTHRLLGAVIAGVHAGELLSELTLAIETGMRLEDIALTIHAHPTLSETSAFAAETALGWCTDQ